MQTGKLVEYLDEYGDSPFSKWFSQLNASAAAKISTALYRMEQGNLSNARSVGKGIFEYKLNFGPGYRIYFAHDGDLLVVLHGGSKKRQGQDINYARELWADYKARK